MNKSAQQQKFISRIQGELCTTGKSKITRMELAVMSLCDSMAIHTWLRKHFGQDIRFIWDFLCDELIITIPKPHPDPVESIWHDTAIGQMLLIRTIQDYMQESPYVYITGKMALKLNLGTRETLTPWLESFLPEMVYIGYLMDHDLMGFVRKDHEHELISEQT